MPPARGWSPDPGEGTHVGWWACQRTKDGAEVPLRRVGRGTRRIHGIRQNVPIQRVGKKPPPPPRHAVIRRVLKKARYRTETRGSSTPQGWGGSIHSHRHERDSEPSSQPPPHLACGSRGSRQISAIEINRRPAKSPLRVVDEGRHKENE